jgi:undecaprenyl phosphate N,N'-diacetylbacillosamine 1-phosphate transferase
MYQNYFKRKFDFLSALIALFFLLPILFFSIIAILCTSPGNPFFTQVRVGENGKLFNIFKLRTMTINPEREIIQIKGYEKDVFFVGKLLRRLKLDELPQLINVLNGDMSLVGPRPCIISTYNEMPTWAKERFCLKPGLTGLAQVNGNIELTWEERWTYDIKYLRNVTLLNDLLIICKTTLIVFFGESKFRRKI